MTALQDVATLADDVVEHVEAGHDESDPALLSDLGTLRTNLDRVLDPLGPPVNDVERAEFIARTVASIKEFLVTLQDDITAAIAAGQAADVQAANDAANRVIATINADKTELDGVKAQLATDEATIATLNAQIATGTVDPATAAAVTAAFAVSKAAIDAIDTTPVVPVTP